MAIYIRYARRRMPETKVSSSSLTTWIRTTTAGNLAWVQTDAALFVAGLLDDAAFCLPLSMDVGRQFLQGHWQRLSVLIGTRVLKVNQENPYKYEQTQVQPAVVVLIHVVEDDEETLVAVILLRTYLIYIAVAGNLAWVQTDAAMRTARRCQ